MAKLDEHPTVIRHRQSPAKLPTNVLDAESSPAPLPGRGGR